MPLQSIHFDRRKFRITDAVRWLRARNIKYIKKDITDGMIKIRIREPDSSKKYITKQLEDGIQAVIML